MGNEVALRRVIVDVETKGCDWRALTEAEQAYLARQERNRDGEAAIVAARDRLALGTLTAEVVAIGLLNPDTGKSRIHLWMPGGGPDPNLHVPDACEIYIHSRESDVLRAFWEDLASYFQVITFNGRSFDGPLLAHRSLVHGVRVGRNLIGNRYDRRHLDLKEALSFYGATRPYSLDFFCRRLGITSPKAHGDGRNVEQLWTDRQFTDLCAYLAGDLCATGELLAKCVAANIAEGPDSGPAGSSHAE